MRASMRGRFLVTAAVLAVLLLGVAIYTQDLFSEYRRNSQRAAEQKESMQRRLNALKAPLRGVENLLYRYAIRLDPALRQEAQRQLQRLESATEALTGEGIERQGPAMQALNKELRIVSRQLDASDRELLAISSNVQTRFPAMGLLTGSMMPSNQAFSGAVERAIEEAYALLDEDPDQAEVLQVLLDLRHYWTQQISAFRVFVANRSGVFGEPGPASFQAMQSRDMYAQQVGRLLQRLEEFETRGSLGFEQSNALPVMQRARQRREGDVAKAAAIYASDDWRADVVLLRTRVQPLVDRVWGLISRFEALLDQRTVADRARARDTLETLSAFIWGFVGLIYLAIVVAYLVFEYTIRRPILRVAEAMEAEAAGEGGLAPLAATRIAETDLLVSAFQLMQRQVSSRQQRIESILDNAGDGIVTIDERGIIESFNRAAQGIFGYRAGQVVGQNISLLMPTPYAKEHDGYIENYLRTGQAKIMGHSREVVGRHSGGRVFPLGLSVSEMRLEDRRLFIGVVRDISARKQVEAQLQRAKSAAEAASAEVRAKNAELTTSMERLEQAREQLVESEKMASLGGLVAGIAHEINTPVGIGVTAVSHLDSQVRDLKVAFDENRLKRSDLAQFVASAGEGTRIIQSNLQRAAELVRSFKQVAVDQASDELRDIEVCGYLRDVLLSLHPRLKKTAHRVDIDCPGPLHIKTYPGALSQILTNLLMNSLEHAYAAGQAGRIDITVIPEDDHFRLQYQDDGKGIPADHIARIFEPFYTTNRGRGGSGLGLHLIYNLVKQRFGGSIRCDSQVGVGTRFVIDLPLHHGNYSSQRNVL